MLLLETAAALAATETMGSAESECKYNPLQRYTLSMKQAAQSAQTATNICETGNSNGWVGTVIRFITWVDTVDYEYLARRSDGLNKRNGFISVIKVNKHSDQSNTT